MVSGLSRDGGGAGGAVGWVRKGERGRAGQGEGQQRSGVGRSVGQFGRSRVWEA